MNDSAETKVITLYAWPAFLFALWLTILSKGPDDVFLKVANDVIAITLPVAFARATFKDRHFSSVEVSPILFHLLSMITWLGSVCTVELCFMSMRSYAWLIAPIVVFFLSWIGVQSHVEKEEKRTYSRKTGTYPRSLISSGIKKFKQQ